MSMQIANNAQSQAAMSYANSHQTNAEKFFDRISTGLKIVSAADNSSAWAVSERMRELIRSFTQDHENVQNSSSLTRTAERGIDQIVQNLRTLKELAIDAANDSNNDWDRRVIQKEVDQRLEIIDDIAQDTKYNGKILLDGRYTISVRAYRNTTISNVLSSISEAYGAFRSSSKRNGARQPEWQFSVDLSFAKNYSNTWSWAKASSGSSDDSTQKNQFAVYLDFSSMTAKKSYPQALHNQGFSILCSGCEQYINILFDASKSADESIYRRPSGSQTNPKAREFIIGVKDVQSNADLAEAILQGAYANKDNITNSGNWDESTEDNVLLDTNHQLRIARDPADPSKILILKDSLELQFRSSAIKTETTQEANPLWVQHGTVSGQRFHIYIKDMTRKALGLDDLSVRTRADANSAIGTIDSAIEYALNEATNLGAYLQRLEVTDLNVTTQNENAQAAESIIRDADMAKELIGYTKNNLLLQSSQAMLAQANQNSQDVANYIF